MAGRDAEAALVALLNAEREHLKAGRLNLLVELAEEKEALMKEVASALPGRETLERIDGLLRRNAALLEAAGSGVQAARRRLKALREAAGPIRSYGAKGQAQAIGRVDPSLSRKA